MLAYLDGTIRDRLAITVSGLDAKKRLGISKLTVRSGPQIGQEVVKFVSE